MVDLSEIIKDVKTWKKMCENNKNENGIKNAYDKIYNAVSNMNQEEILCIRDGVNLSIDGLNEQIKRNLDSIEALREEIDSLNELKNIIDLVNDPNNNKTSQDNQSEMNV